MSGFWSTFVDSVGLVVIGALLGAALYAAGVLTVLCTRSRWHWQLPSPDDRP